MTTKQVASKFHTGLKTFNYFIEKGWVDAPNDPADWQAGEMLVAYFQMRMTIAYHKGWMAWKHGMPIDKHIGTSW